MLSLTVIIVVITCIVSFSAFSNERLLNNLIFYPPAVSEQGQWYRFFTCGLIHGDLAHLFFNMFSLYFFGEMVENEFTEKFGQAGRWLYLLLYVSALLASLMPTYAKNKDNRYYRSLGASGAVSAVMFAGLLLVPNSGVGFFFLPGVSIPGFLFGPLYLLFSAMMDKRGGTNINHSAHLWGAIYGLAFTVVAGYAVGYNVIGYFINGVQEWFQSMGIG